MITTRRRMPLLDLPASERLDSTLGLRAIPRLPLGRRHRSLPAGAAPGRVQREPDRGVSHDDRRPAPDRGFRCDRGDRDHAHPVSRHGRAPRRSTRRAGPWRGTFSWATARACPRTRCRSPCWPWSAGRSAGSTRRWSAGKPAPTRRIAVAMGARPRALAEAFVLQYRGTWPTCWRPGAAACRAAFAARSTSRRCRPPVSSGRVHPYRCAGLPAAVVPTLGGRDVSFVPTDEIAASSRSADIAADRFDGDRPDLGATGGGRPRAGHRARLQHFEQRSTKSDAPRGPIRRRGSAGALATLQALAIRRDDALTETATRDAEGRARSAEADAETGPGRRPGPRRWRQFRPPTVGRRGVLVHPPPCRA